MDMRLRKIRTAAGVIAGLVGATACLFVLDQAFDQEEDGE